MVTPAMPEVFDAIGFLTAWGIMMVAMIALCGAVRRNVKKSGHSRISEAVFSLVHVGVWVVMGVPTHLGSLSSSATARLPAERCSRGSRVGGGDGTGGPPFGAMAAGMLGPSKAEALVGPSWSSSRSPGPVAAPAFWTTSIGSGGRDRYSQASPAMRCGQLGGHSLAPANAVVPDGHDCVGNVAPPACHGVSSGGSIG
jgi:hypothetical protein